MLQGRESKFVRFLERIHEVHCIERKTFQEDVCKNSSNHQTWSQNGKKQLGRQKKQEWANEKPKLDNARRLSCTCFIHLEDAEYKETIKNAMRKLEVPMEAAMPCKKRSKKRSSFRGTEAESCESNKIPKTKHACIVESLMTPQGNEWNHLYEKKSRRSHRW